MGTVGLSFGSATSGAGFDVASTVTAILANDQAVETPWKNQLTTLQAQDTAFTSIGTDLSTLTTNLQALTDFEGVFAQKEGSSSDTSTLALTSASSTAAAGSHEIVVSSLAQTSSIYTNAVSASDTLSGSITLQVGSGTPATIAIGSTNNTLSGLAAAINSAGIGITASILQDPSGARLSLVSGTSGAAGQLTITNALTDATTNAALTTQTGQTGQNASLTVDGVAITSISNTVTNAIPGVTFQLLNTSSSAIQVQITNDTSSVVSAFSSFVTSYNAVVNDLNAQEGKDSSGNAEPLYGDPTLALLQSQLGSALISGGTSGSIASFTQLGMTLNNDGTLTLDTSALTSALDENYTDVTGFLQNTASFGANLASTLNGLGITAPNGAIYLAQQQNASTEASLNGNISDEDARIATEKTSLTAELNTANQILQSIPSQLSEVNEIYSAITGYDQNSGG